MRYAIVLLLAAGALSAGCGLSEPVLFDQDAGIREIRDAVKTPKSWRIEVAPVEINTPEESGEKEWTFRLEPGELKDKAIQALEATKVFQAVLDGNPHTTGESDLRLEMTVTRALGRFEGTNGYFLAQFALWWSISSLVACFVPDEDYSASLDVDLALVDVENGETIWKDRIELVFKASLDHFQKGIDLWDLIPPGTFMAKYDTDKVTKLLKPHLLREFQKSLAKTLAEKVPLPAVDVCVVVGTDFLAPNPAISPSASDARKMAEAFSKNRRRVEVLDLSAKGTRDELEQELTALALRKDIEIRDLLFYFAGRGTLVTPENGKPEPALVLRGKGSGTRTDPAPLLVKDLVAKVKAVPAHSRSVVIDAGFTGGGGRVLGSKEGEDTKINLSFPKVGKNFGMLLAGPSAFESDRHNGGILTHYIEGSLNKEFDLDRNGAISLAEVHSNLAWRIARAQRRAGGGEMPVILGDGILYRLEAPRKVVKPPEEEPGEETPGEVKPPEEEPGEETPGEVKPPEEEPGEETPGEVTPPEEEPGEENPGEATPPEEEPGEETPGEATPPEEEPGEENPGEATPPEEEPGEENPGEATPPEEEPGEETPGEATPPEEEVWKNPDTKVVIAQMRKLVKELKVKKSEYMAKKAELSEALQKDNPEDLTLNQALLKWLVLKKREMEEEGSSGKSGESEESSE